MQKKDNAPCNNQPNGTKHGKPKEANFVKKQVSLCIQHFYLTLAEMLKSPSNQFPQIWNCCGVGDSHIRDYIMRIENGMCLQSNGLMWHPYDLRPPYKTSAAASGIGDCVD
jgi:hypothetical protein